MVSDEFLLAARLADVKMSFVCGRESVLGYLSFSVSELLRQPILTRTSPAVRVESNISVNRVSRVYQN